MGMLSTGRTAVPQDMQRDAGRTTDWPSGTRAMQTLKKLPQIAPHSPASTIAPGDVRNARGSSTDYECYEPRLAEANVSVCVHVHVCVF